MSVIYKCDRCGKEYAPSRSSAEHLGILDHYIVFGTLTWALNRHIDEKNPIDLCKDCFSDLRIWLDNPETTSISVKDGEDEEDEEDYFESPQYYLD